MIYPALNLYTMLTEDPIALHQRSRSFITLSKTAAGKAFLCWCPVFQSPQGCIMWAGFYLCKQLGAPLDRHTKVYKPAILWTVGISFNSLFQKERLLIFLE